LLVLLENKFSSFFHFNLFKLSSKTKVLSEANLKKYLYSLLFTKNQISKVIGLLFLSKAKFLAKKGNHRTKFLTAQNAFKIFDFQLALAQ
jgi:hypothetical protein